MPERSPGAVQAVAPHVQNALAQTAQARAVQGRTRLQGAAPERTKLAPITSEATIQLASRERKERRPDRPVYSARSRHSTASAPRSTERTTSSATTTTTTTTTAANTSAAAASATTTHATTDSSAAASSAAAASTPASAAATTTTTTTTSTTSATSTASRTGRQRLEGLGFSFEGGSGYYPRGSTVPHLHVGVYSSGNTVEFIAYKHSDTLIRRVVHAIYNDGAFNRDGTRRALADMDNDIRAKLDAFCTEYGLQLP